MAHGDHRCAAPAERLPQRAGRQPGRPPPTCCSPPVARRRPPAFRAPCPVPCA